MIGNLERPPHSNLLSDTFKSFAAVFCRFVLLLAHVPGPSAAALGGASFNASFGLNLAPPSDGQCLNISPTQYRWQHISSPDLDDCTDC